MRIEVKSIPYILSHILIIFYFMHLLLKNKNQNNQSLLLNQIKLCPSNLITKPPQSLRFDTLYIALSYGIHPIASGNFIIDIFSHKNTTSIFWRRCRGLFNSFVILNSLFKFHDQLQVPVFVTALDRHPCAIECKSASKQQAAAIEPCAPAIAYAAVRSNVP